MTDTSPKAAVLRASGLFDGTIPGVDRYLQFFSEDAVCEFSPAPGRPAWARIEGKPAARALYHRVYSDRRDGLNESLNVVAEGDLVVIEGRWTSTAATDTCGVAAGTRRRTTARPSSSSATVSSSMPGSTAPLRWW